jgi:hypothetical protein
VEDTGPSDFAENAAGVTRESLGHVGPSLLGERALGIEEISTIEDSSDHIPLGEANGVIPDRIEHAPVHFSLGLGVRGTGRAVPKRGRTRRTGGPFRELLRRCVSQSVVQPHGTKPTVSLGIRHS